MFLEFTMRADTAGGPNVIVFHAVLVSERPKVTGATGTTLS